MKGTVTKRIPVFSMIVGALLVGGTALAQEQGGVKVGGDVDIKAETGDVTTQSQGDGAVAESNVGSVTGRNTQVGGDVDIDVETGDVTTQAQGDGAKACSNVGSVGTSACQQDGGN